MSDRTSRAIVSLLIIIGYLGFGVLLLIGIVKPNVTGDLALRLVDGVFDFWTAAFLASCFYWLGSSSGQDALIAGQLPASPSAPTPAPSPPVSVPQPQLPPAPTPTKPLPAPPSNPNTLTIVGKVSNFGGPNDKGVSPSEGLALCEPAEIGLFPGMFLAEQPSGTTGLARRLDPSARYIACRWDYKKTPRSYLQGIKVIVSANGQFLSAQPIDWGPNINTGRVADLSPGLMAALGLKTDQEATVSVPLPDSAPPVASGEPLWLTLARAEIGFHELPDNHGIQRYVDLAGYGADGEPWCSIFAGAMLRKASINIKGANAMARSWTTAPSVIKVDVPVPGDLAVFWRGSPAGTEGHVGFYVSDAAPGRINVLGGNENDQVEIESIPISGSSMGLLGYWRPASTVAEPKVT